jgi:predicted RNase H-like HicB family nuclease
MGFFDEFPEITAEGENADEAKANLLEALKEVLEYRRYRARQAANENDECREKKSKPDFQLEIA